MNYGAFIYKENLFSSDELKPIIKLALQAQSQKEKMHNSGNYASYKWFRYPLDLKLPFVKKILNELGIENAELIDFYYLDPGTKLHTHRDLTGASLNNRLRFHVPVITNEGVKFTVDGASITMKPGDLWCLDTSYKHSVQNNGSQSRIHIVIECNISEKIRQNIPNDFKSKLQSLFFTIFLIWALIKSIIINSVKDPKYVLSQFGMIIKFVRWRILKTIKPH